MQIIKRGRTDAWQRSATRGWTMWGDYVFRPTGLSPSDAQNLETLDRAAVLVARTFGVPPVMISFIQHNAGSLGRLIKTMFTATTIQPLKDALTDELTQKLLTPAERSSGQMVAFAPLKVLSTDAVELAELADRLVKAGIIEPNEARKMFGLMEHPDGVGLVSPAGAPDKNKTGGRPSQDDASE